MSNYTTELRFLIESNYDIGLQDYPIFDETYRAALNAKIIEHYYFREIGFETASMFKRFVNRTMNEIMPLYNQYYKSALLVFNPLYNYDLQTDSTHTTHSDTSGINNNISESTNNATIGNNKTETSILKDVSSDTPQAQLSIGDIESEIYASNAEFQNNSIASGETGTNLSTINDTTNNTLSSTANNLDTYISHAVGTTSAQSNASLLMEFRKSFVNTDMFIIDELNKLFMGVW